MAVPTITVKWIYGYDLDVDDTPNVGSVTAVISESIRQPGGAIYIENDKAVTSPIDGDGRFALALHPNNQPGDNPLNTSWTLTFSNGESVNLFIPYNASGGSTNALALKWTDFATALVDLPDPATQSALDARISKLETEVGLMNNLDGTGLAALTPPVPTTLVDAAAATSGNVTTTTDGLMLHTDKAKLDSITVANLTTQDTLGVVLPSVVRPTTLTTGTSRVYRNSTSGEVEVAVNVGGTIYYSVLGPGLESPAFQITTDFTITSTTPATVNAGAPLTVVPNALYFISGPIAYTAPGYYDIGIRFSAISAGSTLRWGAVGLNGLGADANFAARPAVTPPASGGVGYIDAALRTGTNEMLLPGQGVTNSLLGAQAQSPQGAVSTYIYGTLRTGSVITAGLNFQARFATAPGQTVPGSPTNPLILAGTSVTFTRVS